MPVLNPPSRDSLLGFFLPVAGLAAFVVLWGVCVRIFRIPDYLLPAPEVVAVEIYERWSVLMWHSLITLTETIAGFFASIIIVVPLAMVIVANRTIDRVVVPLLVMSQSIPKVAIAPLFVVWLGFGFTPKLAVAFLTAFFPLLIATVTGLKSAETEMLDLVKAMGGRGSQLMWKVRAPNALPHFFSGMKISVCLAVVGAVVGEFVGSSQGLGFLVLTSAGDLNGGLLYSTLVILTALGVALFSVVSYLEKVALPWHVSVRTNEESLWQS